MVGHLFKKEKTITMKIIKHQSDQDSRSKYQFVENRDRCYRNMLNATIER